MKSNYRKLGEYIREVNKRNKDLQVSLLLGVSISKEFIPSIANTVGTDFSNYKIVEKGQFAYGPVTSRNGDKISIALLKEDKCIISSSYMVFEIIDKSVLLPEYLMMWFRRPEFDRYARFKSEGSVREIFSWSEMCNIELPVPDIEKQRKIVEQYNQINKAIQIKEAINNNLEQQAQAIFNKSFPFILNGNNNTFEEIIDFSNGKSRPETNGNIPVYGGNGILAYSDTYNSQNCVIIGRVGAYCGNVSICTEKCWVSDNAIQAKSKLGTSQVFVYYLLKNANLYSKHIGTGQPLMTQGILNSITFNKPSIEQVNAFIDICEPIQNLIIRGIKDIESLIKLRDTLLPKLMLENSDSSTAKLSFI